jgi:hypothetical protein
VDRVACCSGSLGSIFLGLISIGTGKDYLPTRVRRLLSRVPASEEDHRLRGMSLVLNGAAMTIFALGITASTLAMINRGSFPRGLFFVTTVAFLAAIACSIGSYVLYWRVRFVSTRASTDAHPGIPPA